jgi:hypothetical protein
MQTHLAFFMATVLLPNPTATSLAISASQSDSNIVAGVGNGRPSDLTRLAVCSCGHARSMVHPAVVTAFTTSFAHMPNAQLFAVIELAHEHEGGHSPDIFSHRYSHELARYNISFLSGTLRFIDHYSNFMAEFFNETGPCRINGSCANQGLGMRNGTQQGKEFERFHGLGSIHKLKACAARTIQEDLSHQPETGQNFAEQIHKASICYGMVKAWEARNGRFDWILKWRPDILLLSPFPSFPLLGPVDRLVFVHAATHDQFFLCPRFMCHGYFAEATTLQKNCTAGPDDFFGFTGYKLGFMGYSQEQVNTTFDIPYALLKEDSPKCPPQKNGLLSGVGQACVRAGAALAQFKLVAAMKTKRGHPVAALAAAEASLTSEIQQIVISEPALAPAPVLVPREPLKPKLQPAPVKTKKRQFTIRISN